MADINRLKVMRHDEVAFDSGANPDFQVTSATRNAQNMQRLMQNLALQSKALDKRMAALDSANALRQQAREAALVAQEPDPVLIEPAGQ